MPRRAGAAPAMPFLYRKTRAWSMTSNPGRSAMSRKSGSAPESSGPLYVSRVHALSGPACMGKLGFRTKIVIW